MAILGHDGDHRPGPFHRPGRNWEALPHQRRRTVLFSREVEFAGYFLINTTVLSADAEQRTSWYNNWSRGSGRLLSLLVNALVFSSSFGTDLPMLEHLSAKLQGASSFFAVAAALGNPSPEVEVQLLKHATWSLLEPPSLEERKMYEHVTYHATMVDGSDIFSATRSRAVTKPTRPTCASKPSASSQPKPAHEDEYADPHCDCTVL